MTGRERTGHDFCHVFVEETVFQNVLGLGDLATGFVPAPSMTASPFLEHLYV